MDAPKRTGGADWPQGSASAEPGPFRPLDLWRCLPESDHLGAGRVDVVAQLHTKHRRCQDRHHHRRMAVGITGDTTVRLRRCATDEVGGAVLDSYLSWYEALRSQLMTSVLRHRCPAILNRQDGEQQDKEPAAHGLHGSFREFRIGARRKPSCKAAFPPGAWCGASQTCVPACQWRCG